MAISQGWRFTRVLPIVLSFLLVAIDRPGPVAGPEGSPLRRMNCETPGEIRRDDGRCAPVEEFFSTGENKIYWVDQRTGSDSNAGTKDHPWKTISRSTGNGILNPGDVVIIRAGIYRETIAPEGGGTDGYWITFSAYPGDEVVISGADPMNEGWSRSGDAWRHEWTLPLPANPNAGTLQERPEFRREMVVVDGRVLTPVYTRSALSPGSFYVEGSDRTPKFIYIRLPSDADPGAHFVEVGYRSRLFLPVGSREDWCGGKNGFYRLVGLTFRHSVANAGWAAVCTGGKGSLFEENTVEWTNGTGISVAGADHVLRGNRANHNGMRGIGGRCANCRLEFNETSLNNWKKHAYGFGAAGIKLIYSTDTVISHHLSADNNGTGVWLDVKNVRCIVENSHIIRNVGRGILVEFGTVHSIIRNNVVYGTRLKGSEGSGIQSQAASSNAYLHNTVVRNEGYGIWIRLSPRDEDGRNSIYNNLLLQNAAGKSGSHSEIRIEGESLAHARTNQLDGNLYSPQNTKASVFVITSPDGTSYKGDDLAQWRRLINGDGAAKVLDENRLVIEDPLSLDGWRLVEGSQAIGQGVELPADLRVHADITSSSRPKSMPDVGAHQRRPAARE